MTNQERNEKLKCIILTVHHTMFLAVETGGKEGSKQWKKAISDALSQINQLFSEGKENHCKDCCCAESWKALGIEKFTGLSIPEHIKELKNEIFELKGGFK